MGRRVQVVCSNGKTYNSIREVAEATGEYEWTIGCKLIAAGGFIDKDGNEYTRVVPSTSKVAYKNTGKTVQCHRQRRRMEDPALPLPELKPISEVPVETKEELVVSRSIPDISISGSNNDFEITVKGLDAARLAELIVLISKGN